MNNRISKKKIKHYIKNCEDKLNELEEKRKKI